MTITPGPVGFAPGPSAPFEGGGEVVLELDAVTKVYPAEPPVVALRDVSFSVRRGELVAIVGPSGSGKSTLLHVMGTLEQPSAGAVRITGLDVSGLDDRSLSVVRATRIGFVFQSFFLAEHQSVLDNVADGLLYAGVPARERRAHAAQALSAVGLAPRSTFRPTKLSGGERQRVAIARALIGAPAIVLADEPTGNLDTATGTAIFALLRELHANGATIVMITHDRELASQLPRQIEMLDGRIISDTRAATGVSVDGAALDDEDS
jgi:putative ABC transport system ATP-binding protein